MPINFAEIDKTEIAYNNGKARCYSIPCHDIIMTALTVENINFYVGFSINKDTISLRKIFPEIYEIFGVEGSPFLRYLSKQQ